jgi:hypothetical protein
MPTLAELRRIARAAFLSGRVTAPVATQSQAPPPG